MTLLIAMEFNHSLFHSVMHRGQIIKVKTVVLIAVLAIARKFIVMQTEQTTPLHIVSYAVAVLFLGIVSWLMDVREKERSGEGPDGIGSQEGMVYQIKTETDAAARQDDRGFSSCNGIGVALKSGADRVRHRCHGAMAQTICIRDESDGQDCHDDRS